MSPTTHPDASSPVNCNDCQTTDLVSLERTRFFPRQLVGPDDLTQDQVYFREKLRRHNRMLHGWGIVCGAEVRQHDNAEPGCTVVVAPGYVLGPFGDEILIDTEVSIDVCKRDTGGTLDCIDPDPWCGDVTRVEDDAPRYLAVRHVERSTRPVRVPGCTCGCDEGECEYSRTRDGFELRVLNVLPTSYTKDPVDWDDTYLAGQGRPCEPCPDSPWVILAELQISDGRIERLSVNHRRYVISNGGYAFVRTDP
jgi:hypothetical protein